MMKGYVPNLVIPPRGSLSPYSSQESLVKYLRSNSPASSGSSSGKGSFRSSKSPLSENAQMRLADDDVLVVDGVLVASDSGVGGSNSSSGFGASYKTEICKAWEDLENCRFGSKCQFAHGKEELRPSRFPSRNKSEKQVCKSYASTGSCMYGSRCRLIHPVIMETTAVISGADSPSSLTTTKQSPSATVKPLVDTSNTHNSTMKHGSPYLSPVYSNYLTTKLNSSKSPKVVTVVSSWSPLDDFIEVALPSHPEKTPSRAEIDKHIQEVLYGPSTRKRLPVFTEFCPE